MLVTAESPNKTMSTERGSDIGLSPLLKGGFALGSSLAGEIAAVPAWRIFNARHREFDESAAGSKPLTRGIAGEGVQDYPRGLRASFPQFRPCSFRTRRTHSRRIFSDRVRRIIDRQS